MANRSVGRPKGSLNRVTLEAREFARSLIDSADYRDSLARRIKKDNLPGGVEVMLWYYTYGKPTDKVEVTMSQGADLESLTADQLAAEARSLSVAILQTKDEANILTTSDGRKVH